MCLKLFLKSSPYDLTLKPNNLNKFTYSFYMLIALGQDSQDSRADRFGAKASPHASGQKVMQLLKLKVINLYDGKGKILNFPKK